MLFQQLAGQVRVGAAVGPRVTGRLHGAGRPDAGSHLGRRTPGQAAAQVLVGHGGHLHVQVDAVQQRAGKPRPIALHRRAKAGAGVPVVGAIPAGAGVHGRHQHAVRRIGQRDGGAGDGHHAVFQRLAHHLQRGLAEFRQLVQKQHPAMGQGNLSGARVGPAAHQAVVRHGVMRRAKRAAGNQPLPVQQARHAVDGGHIQRLLEGERRQHRGYALGQHGLAAAGRADEQQVVCARRRDLDGPLGVLLPLHLGEVHVPVRAALPRGAPARGHCRNVRLPGQKGSRLAQRAHRVHRQSFHHGGLGGVVRRHQHAARPFGAGAHGHGQNARHGLQFAGQGKFAQQKPPVGTALGQYLGGGQQADGKGKIEAAAALAAVGGGEIDGDARGRQAQVAGPHGGENALARFAQRPFGQAHHDEGGHALAGKVHLQVHPEGVHPLQGGAGHANDHQAPCAERVRSGRNRMRTARTRRDMPRHGRVRRGRDAAQGHCMRPAIPHNH